MILAGFIVSAMAIGAMFYAFNKPEYVTQTKYEINLMPPFLGMHEIHADISRTFYSAEMFASWKLRRPGTSLTVELIDQKKEVEGFDFDMPEEGRFVSFNDNKIMIKTNDTQLISEVLDYFEFVGLTLSKRYVAEGQMRQSRFDKLEKRLLPILEPNVAVPTFEIVANIDIYLQKAVEAKQMVLISRPFPPQKTCISTRLMLTIAIILGGASGLVFLLLRKAYQARKLRLEGLEA